MTVPEALTALVGALRGVHAVDLVIGLVVLEAVAIGVHERLTGRGVALRDMLATLVAGLFLLLALRAALGGEDWTLVALPLAAAGVAHAVDLVRRWRRSPAVRWRSNLR